MRPAVHTYARYVLASGVALAADVSAFLLLLRSGADPVASAAAGYAVGILLHWLLSTRFVFLESAGMKGRERLRAKALFVISAVAGLGVTAAVVALSIAAGLSPIVAKLIAIVISFNMTYLARRLWVFSS